MGELERYKAALDKLARFGNGDCYGNSDGNMIAYNALFPPPEMETVEVKRSVCGNCMATYNTDRDACNCCEETATGKAPIIRLTGHFQRPKPVKVERSVSVGVKVDAVGMCSYATGDGEYRPEFADHPECHGKTGVLTFTWQE